MRCETYPFGTLGNYRYVVTLSMYQGRILLSRHQARTTWETQGGHIEPGESPQQAARRELYEESGAMEFDLRPGFDYSAGEGDDMANGQVFLARIERLGELPESEMAQIQLFDRLPEPLTYPEITPCLFERAETLWDMFGNMADDGHRRPGGHCPAEA